MQLNFNSPCAVYKHVADPALNSNSSSAVLVKLKFFRRAKLFLKDFKINLMSQRSRPNFLVIVGLRIFSNFYITAAINIGP